MFVAIATVFTVCMTSGAFACGGGWGSSGWGTSWGGCGGGAYAAIRYAPVTVYAPVPVTTYAQPLAPAPIGVGGCSCHSQALYAPQPVAPTPLYVVNQGPEYVGPGLMEPYRNYSPEATYAPTAAYPYVSGYRSHRYYSGGTRYAFGARGYFHAHASGPHFYRAAPRWHLYHH
jgi:hypothetical protein